MSLKRLAAPALHHQRALRSYGPLKRQIERSEVRYTIADGQSRRDPDIWALRSGAPGGDAVNETTSVRPIVERRRVRR
jgi:hypothetical protein